MSQKCHGNYKIVTIFSKLELYKFLNAWAIANLFDIVLVWLGLNIGQNFDFTFDSELAHQGGDVDLLFVQVALFAGRKDADFG